MVDLAAPALVVDQLPGQTLEGRYLIGQQIGAGGMSTVFQATHVKIGRTVAIKVLHPALASDPDLVARFLKEARAVGTFGHPNIVASTDFGELPGHVPYLVLEYLDGRTLGHELKTGGALSVPRALHIASQIASALVAAHAKGVVHRDLNAENVFLTRVGTDPDHVKVLDFGISKFLAPPPRDGELAAAENALEPGATTQRGLAMGTPEFMAPEQISEPSAVDARVDIYALGVVLYYMLAGRTPFGTPFGRLPAHVLLNRVLVSPVPIIERSDIPDGVRALIMKALAKDPEQRFASMREMELALAPFLSPYDQPPARRDRRTGPQRWLVFGTVSALAVALVVGLVLRPRVAVIAPGRRAVGSGSMPAPTTGVVLAPATGVARPEVAAPPAAPAPVAPTPAAPIGARPSATADTKAPLNVRGDNGHRAWLAEHGKGARAATRQHGSVSRRPEEETSAAPVAALTAPPAAQVAPPPSSGRAPNAAAPAAALAPAAPAQVDAPSGPVASIDPVAAQAAVRARLPEIERCYARGKMDDPELRGRVTVRIHVAPGGAVTADELESSTVANSAVESCIVDAIRGWRFPPPRGGRAAVISYPFNLR